MSTEAINYAQFYGIHSVAAAIIFAVAYVPFFGLFVYRSIGRPTYVFIVLALFCAIRIAAFAIRAVLAGVTSTGESLSVLIADEVLISVGFFGLLYSAYTLVLERETFAGVEYGGSPIGNIMRLAGNQRLFRLVLLAAVVLGIVGVSQASGSNPMNGNTLRKVSVIIFLILTILVALRTLRLASTELTLGESKDTRGDPKRASVVLSTIALLLLVREVFAVATMSDFAKQNNEDYWYPLYALPELLAVMLYSTPNLLPPRSELPSYSTVRPSE